MPTTGVPPVAGEIGASVTDTPCSHLAMASSIR
jgi:hypothetical protein